MPQKKAKNIIQEKKKCKIKGKNTPRKIFLFICIIFNNRNVHSDAIFLLFHFFSRMYVLFILYM